MPQNHNIKYRRKGAILVKNKKGILVVSGKSGKYILPGGGANRGERRRDAAIRELKEETGLDVVKIRQLGNYTGKTFKSYSGKKIKNLGKLYSAKVKGKARPRNEIKKIAYWKPGSKIPISKGTENLIKQYSEQTTRRRNSNPGNILFGG